MCEKSWRITANMKEHALVAVDQLRALIEQPDTDDLAYIRTQVRDVFKEILDLLEE